MTEIDKIRKKVQRRKERNRWKLKKVGSRNRVSVYRSNQNVSVQIVDDNKGLTLVSGSTLEKEFREKLGKGSNKAAAYELGKLVGERALAGGLKEVMFDRGWLKYHGRIKALAEGLRESGLEF